MDNMHPMGEAINDVSTSCDQCQCMKCAHGPTMNNMCGICMKCTGTPNTDKPCYVDGKR